MNGLHAEYRPPWRGRLASAFRPASAAGFVYSERCNLLSARGLCAITVWSRARVRPYGMKAEHWPPGAWVRAFASGAPGLPQGLRMDVALAIVTIGAIITAAAIAAYGGVVRHSKSTLGLITSKVLLAALARRTSAFGPKRT
jgi:hypothetical protein